MSYLIRTFGIKKDLDAYFDFDLDSLMDHDFKWYWVDFDCPSEPEIDLLRKYFKFHPLSIEDCIF